MNYACCLKFQNIAKFLPHFLVTLSKNLSFGHLKKIIFYFLNENIQIN